MSIAPFPFERQAPLMPMTPRQRAQQQVQGELIPQMAELLLQCVKGTKAIRLADLRSEESRAVFLAEILMLLEPERIAEMKMRVHAADAAFFASREAEQAAVERQARQDVLTYGDPLLAKFMRTSPQYCPLCGEDLITNAADVLLTAHLRGRAHGLCCAKNDARFEFVNEFTYRLVPRG